MQLPRVLVGPQQRIRGTDHDGPVASGRCTLDRPRLDGKISPGPQIAQLDLRGFRGPAEYREGVRGGDPSAPFAPGMDAYQLPCCPIDAVRGVAQGTNSRAPRARPGRIKNRPNSATPAKPLGERCASDVGAISSNSADPCQASVRVHCPWALSGLLFPSNVSAGRLANHSIVLVNSNLGSRIALRGQGIRSPHAHEQIECSTRPTSGDAVGARCLLDRPDFGTHDTFDSRCRQGLRSGLRERTVRQHHRSVSVAREGIGVS